MSTTAATRSSLMLASAISRDPALQVCPALQKMPQATAVAAACSSLTSPSTTWADLPPHSSATCLALDSAAQPRNRRPTSADRRVAKRAIDEELMPHPRPGDQGGPQYYRASPIGPSPFSCAFSQLCLHSAGASTGRPPARRFPRRGPALPAGKRTRPGPPAPARPREVTRPPAATYRFAIRPRPLVQVCGVNQRLPSCASSAMVRVRSIPIDSTTSGWMTSSALYDTQTPPILALTSGTIDVVGQFSVTGGEQLLSGGYNVIKLKSSAHRELSMRNDIAPFTDARVRQAIALTLSRPAIVQALFKGYADIGNDSPFAPVFPSTRL